jgi:hypothetical protein
LPRSEKFTVLLIASLTVCVANMPYLIASASAPPDWEFGGVVMNFEDAHGYLAKMRQGAEGNLMYRIPFTSEDHEGAFVGGFFLALGWICALTGMPVEWMWHLSRILFGFLLLLASYFFIALFIEDKTQRLVAYLLVCFASGFGWLVLIAGRFSVLGFDLIDFKMPEAHTFFTLVTFPHFAVGASLLLILFSLAALLHRHWRWRYLLAGAAASFLLAIVHPYNLLVVAVTLGMWLLFFSWRERRLPVREALGLALIGLPALPPLLYYLQVFATNPVFGAWAGQSGSPSPHPLHYLIGYGPLLILAVPAMVDRARRGDTESIMHVIWIGTVALLLYAPLKQQRRMVEGVHVPLSLLAAMGLYGYYLPRLERSPTLRKLLTLRGGGYSPRRMRSFLVFLILVLTIPSNLYILASLSATAIIHPYPFFHEREEIEAVEWLDEETQPHETVLASYGTGSYIPSRINHRVFLGYWAETAQCEEKMRLVDRFFQSSTPDSWRKEFLAEYAIAYLFYGPRESVLGDYTPGSSPYLSPLFGNPLVTIYRVEKQDL